MWFWLMVDLDASCSVAAVCKLACWVWFLVETTAWLMSALEVILVKKKNKKSRSWISKTGRKRKKGKKKTPKFAVACLFYNSSRLLSLDRHAGLMAAAQGLIFKLPQTPVAPINEAAGWVREARWEHNSILLVVLTDSVLWGWIWRACAKWLCR